MNDERPIAEYDAFYNVFLYSSSTSTFFSWTVSFFLASNIGRGLGLGHNFYPLCVIIALPTTSSSRSILNYPSLLTIVLKNLVILLAYKADDYPPNLEGKSV
jgi:hypothetical protein